jgi:hypothetical protein
MEFENEMRLQLCLYLLQCSRIFTGKSNFCEKKEEWMEKITVNMIR